MAANGLDAEETGKLGNNRFKLRNQTVYNVKRL
jgi:hypothetical protein